MLVITQTDKNTISIKADYYYRIRLKGITSSRYNPDTKQWEIDKRYLKDLEEEFKGELVYKTPRWVILNEPIPDLTKMYEIKDKSIRTPSLKIKPYDYQDYAIRFMVDKIKRYGCVLNASEVGLGKTLMAIGCLKWYIENKGIKKVLIICKKSIKQQWIDEIKKISNIDKDFIITKTETGAAQRRRIYEIYNNSERSILITNYHTFLNDTDIISKMDIDFVIIDEIHELKNKRGKLNNNIGSVVQNKRCIMLTGTPIMSKPEDLFGIMQIVKPKYFGKYKEFSNRYLTIDYQSKFGVRIVGAKNLEELREKIQDILIRYTEYEISIQLPSVRVIQMSCEMDKTQLEILKKIKETEMMLIESIERLKENNKIPDYNMDKYNRIETSLKALIAAKQAVCTDPRMFMHSSSKGMREQYGKLVSSSYKMSHKTETILDIIQDIISNDDKVLIFSKFRTSAYLIGEDIKSALKEKVLLYTGNEDEQERDDAIYKFKNIDEYKILIGTEAMSTGLNLETAKYIINIDQPDTYAIKQQRIGRARRASSTYNNIIVYDMITKGVDGVKTKDEERLENIEKNKDVTDGLVNLDQAQQQALIKTLKGE